MALMLGQFKIFVFPFRSAILIRIPLTSSSNANGRLLHHKPELLAYLMILEDDIRKMKEEVQDVIRSRKTASLRASQPAAFQNSLHSWLPVCV